MANQDVGQGWGDLKCTFTEWYCPKCKLNYPVAAWEVSNGELNGHRIQGRNCPCATCDFRAYTNADTMFMTPRVIVPVVVPVAVLPAPVVAKKVISKKKVAKKVVKKPSKGKPK